MDGAVTGVDVGASARPADPRAEALVREVGLLPEMLSGAVAEPRDPYLAAYVAAMGVVVERAHAASAGEHDWVLRVRAALRTLLGELSACPELARACVVVSERVDEWARLSLDSVLERFGELIWPAAEDQAGTAVARSRVLAGEVLALIGETASDGSAAALPGLLVQLHWWVVALRSL